MTYSDIVMKENSLCSLVELSFYLYTVPGLSSCIYPNATTRAHAFPVRVITVWNRLPADVVLASSLLLFKNRL